MKFIKKYKTATYSQTQLDEIKKFREMLLKMKKKRKNFDVIKVINLVYPDCDKF